MSSRLLCCSQRRGREEKKRKHGEKILELKWFDFVISRQERRRFGFDFFMRWESNFMTTSPHPWDSSGGGQNKRNLRRFIHVFGETYSRVFLESPIRDASKYLKFRLNKRRLVWSAWSKAATTKIAKQFHLQWQFPTIASLQVGLCSKRALSERFVGLDLAHGNRFSRTVKRSFSNISQCKVSCECASRLCNKFHCSGFRYRFNFLGRFTADC